MLLLLDCFSLSGLDPGWGLGNLGELAWSIVCLFTGVFWVALQLITQDSWRGYMSTQTAQCPPEKLEVAGSRTWKPDMDIDKHELWAVLAVTQAVIYSVMLTWLWGLLYINADMIRTCNKGTLALNQSMDAATFRSSGRSMLPSIAFLNQAMLHHAK